MASALVHGLLNDLNKLAREESELLVGENEDLQSLSVQLKHMSYLLNAVDGVNQKHESLEVLLKKLTELAHDAKEIIDEYVHHHKQSQQRKFPGGSKITTMRSSIPKKMEDFKKKTQAIYYNKDMLKIELNHDGEVSVPEFPSDERGWKSVVEDANIVGFTNEVQALIDRLLGRDPRLDIVSIIGMVGLGKTALAKEIYNHLIIRFCFGIRIWVHVSQENTLERITLSILRFFMTDAAEIEQMTLKDRELVLYHHLEGKKYLIVLDDVLDHQVLDLLVSILPDVENGSRILLTSRSKKVGLYANPNPKNSPHYLRFLDKKESFELFRSKAFPGGNCSQKWEKLGRQIVEKCGGLPLAISFFGSLLSKDRERLNYDWDLYNEWSRIPGNVSTSLYKRSTQFQEICASGFNELPDYIKKCFLYLAAFPPSYHIPARQLVQLWIAEGFIQENDEETMEDAGDRFLEMLADRDLIQVEQRRLNGQVKTCSIHCLYRGFCISEAERTGFLYFHRLINSPLLAEPHPLNSPLPTEPRCLVVDGSSITHISSNNIKFTKLQTLLCFTHMSGTSGAWTSLFKTITLLKVFMVLQLRILPEVVKDLVQLRYLGLDKNSSLQDPSSLSNLLHLQVLDARSKFIRSVPVGIWKLKKLRHVYFDGSTYLPQPQLLSRPQATPRLQSQPQPLLPQRSRPPSPPPLPSGPQWSKSRMPVPSPPPLPVLVPPPSSHGDDSGGDNDDTLKDLQTLSTISAECCTPEVFQKLPNLLKLGIRVKGYLKALNENLAMLKRLHTLKLAGGPEFPPLISLPLKFPPYLTKLTICDTHLQEDPMQALGVLTKLQILKLSNNAYTGTKIVCSGPGFPCLRVFKLVSLENVRELITMPGGLPNLEHLVIHDCNNLRVCTGLWNLTQLLAVDLLKPDKALRRQMQRFHDENQFQLQIYQ